MAHPSKPRSEDESSRKLRTVGKKEEKRKETWCGNGGGSLRSTKLQGGVDPRTRDRSGKTFRGVRGSLDLELEFIGYLGSDILESYRGARDALETHAVEGEPRQLADLHLPLDGGVRVAVHAEEQVLLWLVEVALVRPQNTLDLLHDAVRMQGAGRLHVPGEPQRPGLRRHGPAHPPIARVVVVDDVVMVVVVRLVSSGKHGRGGGRGRSGERDVVLLSWRGCRGLARSVLLLPVWHGPGSCERTPLQKYKSWETTNKSR